MTDIARDRWGRPLIIPVDGGKPVGYTRVSTLAKTIEDQSNLMLWKQRLTAVGLARKPELALRVAGVIASHDDPVGDGRKDLNSIIAEATEAAGGSAAASTGTALHELTEAMDRHREIPVLPASVMDHLSAYSWTMAMLNVLDIETFVVCDELQTAGTFDRLVRLEDGRVVVADLKTGAHDPTYPLGVATQIAIYAHGLRYDPITGERTPLHPDLDPTCGLLIHLPAKASPATCTLYELDLVVGWEVAQVSARVRELRKAKPIKQLSAFAVDSAGAA